MQPPAAGWPIEVIATMSNFWIIRQRGAAVEGPFTSAQVKNMALRGELAPEAMVAGDGTQWAPAGRVKGLTFGSTTPMAPAHSPSAATAPHSYASSSPAAFGAPELGQDAYALEPAPATRVPSALPVAPPVVDHPPLLPAASATIALGVPDATGRVAIAQPRNAVPLVVAASALIGLNLVQLGFSIAEMVEETQRPVSRFDADFVWQTSTTLSCVGALLYLGLWGFWLAWLYMVHADVARFTQQRYHTSPGLALGLCFVPFFNIYWQVAAPYKLAKFIEEHFRQRGIAMAAASPFVHHRIDTSPTSRSPTSAAAVMALHICSYFAGCVLPGATMLLIAIAALLIQRGLNRIWTDAMANVPAAAPTVYPS